MSYSFVVYKNYIDKFTAKEIKNTNTFLIDFGNDLRDFFRKWHRFHNKNGHLILNQYIHLLDDNSHEPVFEIENLHYSNYQLIKLYEFLQKNTLIRRFCFLKLCGKTINEICDTCKVSKHTFYKHMSMLKDAVIEN